MSSSRSFTDWLRIAAIVAVALIFFVLAVAVAVSRASAAGGGHGKGQVVAIPNLPGEVEVASALTWDILGWNEIKVTKKAYAGERVNRAIVTLSNVSASPIEAWVFTTNTFVENGPYVEVGYDANILNKCGRISLAPGQTLTSTTVAFRVVGVGKLIDAKVGADYTMDLCLLK